MAMKQSIIQSLILWRRCLMARAKAWAKGGAEAYQAEKLNQEETNLRKQLTAEGLDPMKLELWPSRSRKDTGLWWRMNRMWLAREGANWFILASGPRPYRQTLSPEQIAGARYNHITGQLVFRIPDSPQTLSLKFNSREGYHLIDLLHANTTLAYA